jgi:hypothetical protein
MPSHHRNPDILSRKNQMTMMAMMDIPCGSQAERGNGQSLQSSSANGAQLLVCIPEVVVMQ